MKKLYLCFYIASALWAQQDLLVNSGFINSTGHFSLDGWQQTNMIDAERLPSPLEGFFVDNNGGSTGTLAQTFTAPETTTYMLSFLGKANTNVSLEVSFDGGGEIFTQGTAPKGHATSVTLAQGSHTLLFTLADGQFFLGYPVIHNPTQSFLAIGVTGGSFLATSMTMCNSNTALFENRHDLFAAPPKTHTAANALLHPYVAELDQQSNLSASDEGVSQGAGSSRSKICASFAENGSCQDSVFVWGRPLGQYIHEGKTSSHPSYFIASGGAMAGADWKVADHSVGFGAGYVYSLVDLSQHTGHTNINQGIVSPYAILRFDPCEVNLALSGGYANLSNSRTLVLGSSTVASDISANLHSWQLAPHADIRYSIAQNCPWQNIEVFAMGDWCATWRSSYQESGSSVHNVKEDSAFASFLRLESGLRWMQRLDTSCGLFVLREKVGYAYQRAFADATTPVEVIAGAFTVFVPNETHVQNLGVVGMAVKYVAKGQYMPDVEFSTEAQLGSIFKSAIASIILSKNF